jgi:WhiB family redox-sensing transcriptional regulator
MGKIVELTGLFGWREQAACQGMDTDLFYPTEESDLKPYIRLICARCPVRVECLNESMRVSEDYGVWGGYLPRTRQLMRKSR